jgi:hypothetical protein
MRKFANYIILPDLSLILECCKGTASAEDAIRMKRDELADKLYNPEFNIIVDIQEFETGLNITTTESVSDFFNFLKELKLKSKVAFLTAKPHQVVIGEILKRSSKELLSLEIEIFSTLEAAVRFLGFPAEKFDLINRKMSDLNGDTTL